MSLFREVFSGYAHRMRLENSLQLQSAKILRPVQIKLQVATVMRGITTELADPALKAEFDKIELTVPE